MIYFTIFNLLILLYIGGTNEIVNSNRADLKTFFSLLR